MKWFLIFIAGLAAALWGLSKYQPTPSPASLPELATPTYSETPPWDGERLSGWTPETVHATRIAVAQSASWSPKIVYEDAGGGVVSYVVYARRLCYTNGNVMVQDTAVTWLRGDELMHATTDGVGCIWLPLHEDMVVLWGEQQFPVRAGTDNLCLHVEAPKLDNCRWWEE